MGRPTCLIDFCLNFQLQVDILQSRHGNTVSNNTQMGVGVEVRKQACRQK